MPKPLRFTGETPPLHLWVEFPNWRNALEEECDEEQDETTLMPDEVQSRVGDHTSFTAGRVRFHDGREYPAFLEVGENCIDGCSVYESDDPWRIHYSYPEKRWISFNAEWLPEAERPPSVSLEDANVFPLEIYLAVPWCEGQKPTAYRVTADGNMHEIEI